MSQDELTPEQTEAERAAAEYASHVPVMTYLDQSVIRNAFLAGAIHGLDIASRIHKEVIEDAGR